jgi:peptidyl-Asp metalloendopeptidase
MMILILLDCLRRLWHLLLPVGDGACAPLWIEGLEQRSLLSGPEALTVTPLPRSTVVDMMVIYTPRVSKQAGSSSAAAQSALRAVDQTNLAFRNSGIRVYLRAVYVGQIDYRESGRLHIDLRRLAATRDGYMDQVHALRNRYGADLVTLLVGRGDLAGLAYQLEDLRDRTNASFAFSVVLAEEAQAPHYTLAHELGHKFGAQHDKANTDARGLFAYSHGWRFQAAGRVYRDIMAYEPGRRIPYFSNPRILYRGVPTGDARTGDSARTINKSAPFVAAYRPERVVEGVIAA